MNLLFAINHSFLYQMLTTLTSVIENSQSEVEAVYVLHKGKLEGEGQVQKLAAKFAFDLHLINMDKADFSQAPVSKRYPETIYYRLLAQDFLPADLDRILYLDADILCINDLTELYQLDLGDNLYAAASHSRLTRLSDEFNRVRLQREDGGAYYNSGVLLMNLPALRDQVQAKAIYQYIASHYYQLFLPDQDVLNALYGHQVYALPDQVYNYDMRYQKTYELISAGEWDDHWVISHTALLHFCGKRKPWDPNANDKYALLYQHYWQRMRRYLSEEDL
ncbi:MULTISPECIES: glycosyltransferase family 8 protein [Aerococcus]|uniref:Glycosyltransferase family 8 protein n=1 Tax=Aerococcus sanguinicola TaxID=119206 RepID=A0A5N1GIW5_9LACT|nr:MULTISPECIES: glycosyltransferase family 8 protein [Aerococcus]KAA9300917.1 glycosyltransferase family 8 protein [Aerococcus sanguinicola]MDK6369150.1 glycosyltransferase family 8 protein [Aerococcus sp. UMB9870]MDK6679790.1 glycosyltransferase family 8 protein [Aerococcus sp. UMB8608]MDK6686643.1 glycosyltransferase family 8 protein [Aerococcus sp. UMB8623]MDK6939712.1 glycosyltransferase family 8 protein [Aerococcus sp. UMB8487]